MDKYNLRWGHEGKIWNAILTQIQTVVNDIAVPLNAEIIYERWDIPGIDIRWYHDDIGRGIQINITDHSGGGYELRIDSSAWKDIEEESSSHTRRRRRMWKAMEGHATMPVPLDKPTELDLKGLYTHLCNVKEEVCSWTEESLDKDDPLPELPSGWSGRIDRGRLLSNFEIKRE
jgi:hypothetical protein